MALTVLLVVLRVQAAVVIAAALGWLAVEVRSALRPRPRLKGSG